MGSRFTLTVVTLALVMGSVATLLLPHAVTGVQVGLAVGLGLLATVRHARRVPALPQRQPHGP